MAGKPIKHLWSTNPPAVWRVCSVCKRKLIEHSNFRRRWSYGDGERYHDVCNDCHTSYRKALWEENKGKSDSILVSDTAMRKGIAVTKRLYVQNMDYHNSHRRPDKSHVKQF